MKMLHKVDIGNCIFEMSHTRHEIEMSSMAMAMAMAMNEIFKMNI